MLQILCDQITDADILFIPRKLERQSENIFSFSCSHVQTTSINKSVSQIQAVKTKKKTLKLQQSVTLLGPLVSLRASDAVRQLGR